MPCRYGVSIIVAVCCLDTFLFRGFSISNLIVAIIASVVARLLWELAKKFALYKRLGMDDDMSEKPPQTANDYEKERERCLLYTSDAADE